MTSPEGMVNVRYLVGDVQAAIVTGPGGKRILIEDPAANVAEPFGSVGLQPSR